ncbi:MAG: hypothetical protein IJ004_04350 [Clostridia bacterium]|nr:hypothetical protein [Clostridia bacterium]
MTDYYYIDYYDEKTMKQRFINMVMEQARKEPFIEKEFLSIVTDTSKLNYRVVLNGVLSFFVNVMVCSEFSTRRSGILDTDVITNYSYEIGEMRPQISLLDKGLKGNYEPYNDKKFYTDKYSQEKPEYAVNIPQVLGFSESMEKAILQCDASEYSKLARLKAETESDISDERLLGSKPKYKSVVGAPRLSYADRYISPTYEISFIYKGKKISVWFNKEGNAISKMEYPIDPAEQLRRDKEKKEREEAEKARKKAETKAERRIGAFIIPSRIIAIYNAVAAITIFFKIGASSQWSNGLTVGLLTLILGGAATVGVFVQGIMAGNEYPTCEERSQLVWAIILCILIIPLAVWFTYVAFTPFMYSI